MIVRVWHCWTSIENADKLEYLLRTEIFVGIKNRNIPGLNDIKLLKKTDGDEIEFLILVYFSSMDSVKIFAGENYETPIVPEKVGALLTSYDKISLHYEIVV